MSGHRPLDIQQFDTVCDQTNPQLFSGYVDFRGLPRSALPDSQTGEGKQNAQTPHSSEAHQFSNSSSEAIYFTNLFSPKNKGADESAPILQFEPGRRYLYNRSGEPLYGGALERKMGAIR